ncbi:glucuronoxylan 4-O-methyltransferase 1-like [Triticum dicoccoides]|uniref:glucuronoxylan 4-O-methyltransferase 1-like n=1 Tax=Triticum dicoccoides TaxID=85692 RepID=UPI000E7928C0|nr:glucuronoxylan 4-O-methyltransferase 1-like [Triticum dicoccoides]
MMMSPKQLLTTILIVFSTLSFIKLMLLTHSASSSPARPGRSAWDAGGSGNGTAAAATDGLNAKEFALLRSVVAARAPCGLLVFGLSPQLLALAAVNDGQGAATAFVTDSAEDAASARRVLAGRGPGGSAAVHRTTYPDPAGEAWALLRRARASPVCGRPTGTVRKSGCRLALTSLPREVLDARWDVVVVDGPSGAGPGEPGRMGAIYTAAALARAAGGGAVDVAVHNMNRTVERWYAREYLCEDNLVAAKGRLWHFRVAAGGPPDAFCSTAPVQIF